MQSVTFSRQRTHMPNSVATILTTPNRDFGVCYENPDGSALQCR